MAAVDESARKSTVREYYEALLIAIVFVNFARIFAFQAFKIPSGSMEDNLLVGDHIVVNKFIYGPQAAVAGGLLPLRDVRRGDVIVFRYPEQPDVDFVKRVVALPGETILIRDKKVSVDGRTLDEPYVTLSDHRTYPGGPYLPEPYRSRDQFGPYRVPPGHYFAMGDNRDQSHDSRFWGPVPRSLIKGRAFMVYWSFELPPPQGSSLRDRLEELGKVLLYFIPRTRWDRTFFIVDSTHHHTRGATAYGTD